MVLYTLDRGFQRQETIDAFDSAIWTERYYGDGDFELNVPANNTMLAKLPKGQLMMCEGSDRPMILETRDIKDGVIKATGIALTQWLNNRTIRTSADHAVKEWVLDGLKPGQAMSEIVKQMCITSSYLNGSIPIGIPPSQTALFAIPGLQIGAIDASGSVVEFAVPFGPVYEALKQIATSYSVGMKIVLDSVSTSSYVIKFHTYIGADRTSGQNVNPVIRFSPDMDTFTNARDLDSVTDYRNYIFIFAPNADPAIITTIGMAIAPTAPPGFDLRVFQGFLESMPDGIDSTTLANLLGQQANTELANRKVVQLVDGEIVQTGQILFNRDYFLGDIVEVEGNLGVIQNARITEYIRSQDGAGERAYPTLTMID